MIRFATVPRIAARYRHALKHRQDGDVQHCRRICREFGTTYYFATRFFPAEVRPDVWALYAWVRTPDEWVDNPGGLSVDERRRLVDDWRVATHRAVKTGDASDPVLRAWGRAARLRCVPAGYMDDFLDAMVADLSVSRYGSMDDLRGYTWGSASAVGLMMCHLVGDVESWGTGHASSLGTAMQLTNFLRDVGEDWRDRGRIYLPLDDLARFGVSEDDIANGRITDNWRELMRFEIKRTRALYAHADAGMDALPKAARRPVRLARILYSEILDRIERNDYDVFSQRARVPTSRKLSVLARDLRR